MPAKPRALLLSSILISFPLLPAFGQDAPSLGEAARKTRQQEKAQPGNSSATPKAAKVVSDEDAPQPPREPASSSASGDQGSPASNAKSASVTQKRSAAEWKQLILAQKSGINAMQAAIDKLDESIQFAPANCVAGCVQWNERQLQKKQEVERARAQLEEQKKRLADMQEAARQQGYGGSVYDP
jgi:hypothetical protein